jgi:hypothetical protein
LNSGLQRFAEGDRLGGDHMHQRSALQARENGRVDLLGDASSLDRIMPPRGPRSVLCVVVVPHGHRGTGRVNAAGHEAGEMRHVDHQDRADLVGDLAEAGLKSKCANRPSHRR